MNRSPLQLKHYHYVTLALHAREDIDATTLACSDGPYPDIDGIHCEPEVTLLSNDGADEGGPYLLRLAMQRQPDDDQFPYSFEVIIEGVFAISDTDQVADCKKTVVINGASVLYSAAREQLLTLSGRHMYGPMLLPALNFQHLEV